MSAKVDVGLKDGGFFIPDIKNDKFPLFVIRSVNVTITFEPTFLQVAFLTLIGDASPLQVTLKGIDNSRGNVKRIISPMKIGTEDLNAT